MRQNLRDDGWIFDAGENLQLPAAAGAGFDLDAKDTLQRCAQFIATWRGVVGLSGSA